MEIENKYKYFAFISYKREDEEWAKWLQHKLEHYKLPSNLNGRTDLPKEIRPVFKDTSELNPGNLPQQIHDALDQSKFLIVICSPRSAQSEWVNKEVETFMEMGKTERIIPFIIDGKAFAKDPSEECFPMAIRSLPSEQEILGANIGEMGRDAAAVKVVAQMFGLKFDELWQRYEREQRKKRLLIIAGALLLALTGIGVAVGFSQQNKRIREQNERITKQNEDILNKNERLQNDSIVMAAQMDSINKRDVLILEQQDSLAATNDNLEVANSQLTTERNNLKAANRKLMENRNRIIARQSNSLIDKGDCYLARIVSYEALETGPYVPELEYTLRYSSLYDKAILKGHTYIVFSVAYSPDGNLIASASGDNTVRIWDAKTGACLHILSGHTYFVESIVFSPDSKYVISGSLDNTLRVWDLSDGSCIKVLQVDDFDQGNRITFLPDNKTFVSWSKEVVFWDFKTLECIKRKKCPNVKAVSPNGNYYATQSFDNTWHIFDINTGEETCSLVGHTVWTKIAFSPDGKLIVTGAGDNIDNTIRIWDSKTGDCLYVLENPDQSIIYSIHFSPDGNKIIASLGGYVMGNSYVVRIWEKRSDYWIFFNELKGHSANVYDAIFSPDMKHIVSGSEDQTVRIWEGSKWSFGNEKKSQILMDDNGFECAMLSPDGIHIAAIGDSSYIIGENSPIVLEGNPQGTPAFSPDGKTLVSVTSNGLVGLWNVETGACIKTFGSGMFGLDVFSPVAFSPDGNIVASVSKSRTVCLWDVASGMETRTLKGQTQDVSSIAFMPNGKQIVTASEDGTIRIWNINSGDCSKTLEGHIAAVTFVDVSADGKHILSASRDHTIRLWDAKTGKCNRTIGSHDGSVWEARFSPDAKLIVSVEVEDECDKIKVWDIESGQCIYKLDEPNWGDMGIRNIGNVMFNSKCNKLIGANNDLMVWPLPPLQNFIDQTRERFKDRPLTPEERRMYYLE